MILQTAPAEAPHLAITMDEHTRFAAQLARAFGNDRFEPLVPLELMLYVIEHHDEGWAPFDRAPAGDPATRLPYNLIETPVTDLVKTGKGSPDFNEAHHAYCGLLSSMHISGLYNGRYGASDKVLPDSIDPAERPAVDRLLASELARQERLRARLAADVLTAGWIAHVHVFQNYKQLQFFDTLALYFNRTHPGARVGDRFTHVPLDTERDTDVSIEPLNAHTYALSPYPFGTSPLCCSFSGRYIRPTSSDVGSDWGATLRRTPWYIEYVTLVAG
jgi:hypothetical protein